MHFNHINFISFYSVRNAYVAREVVASLSHTLLIIILITEASTSTILYMFALASDSNARRLSIVDIVSPSRNTGRTLYTSFAQHLTTCSVHVMGNVA